MVSESVVKAMMEIAALSFVLPVAFVLLWKMWNRKSIIPSFTGALVFITFGVILKSVPNMLFLNIDSPVSRFIKGNIWIYAIFAGLMAGIFEETGRFAAFKIFLNKHDYRECAVAYGLGHGGIECMFVLGFSMLQNFAYAQLINAGQMADIYKDLPNESAVNVFKELEEAIINLSMQDCIWAGVERLSAMVLQVSLSILVFQAVNIEKKKHFLAIAIVLHALIDVFAVFSQQGTLSLAATEIIIIIYAVIVAVFAYRVYKNLPHTEKGSSTSKGSWAYASMKYPAKNTDGNTSIQDNKDGQE